MIEHEPTFQTPAPRTTVKQQEDAHALAACYARTFGDEDGLRTLADLKKKFSHARPRYPKTQRPDHAFAAVIDGECNVLREIEEGISIGAPFTKITKHE